MTLLIISIALEVAVAVVAALGALKGRPYLYGLALPFTVYVLYDLGRLLGWSVEKGVLWLSFYWRAPALYSRSGAFTATRHNCPFPPWR